MRRRNRNKKQVKIVIGTALCLLLVMATGYAAFSTNLTLSAKGNIKDLVTIKQLVDKNLTDSGDGLYFDAVNATVNPGEKRYIFRGGNPNNYIYFNRELWRIIAIENDGTVKIIRNDSLPSRVYDSATTNTTGPRLNSNNTFCRLDIDNVYYGCNVWGRIDGIFTNSSRSGTISQNAELNDYLNGEYYNSFSEATKQQIVSHEFRNGVVLGTAADINTLVASQQQEHSTGVSWTGKIALISIVDYLKATLNESCTSIYSGRQSPYPCGDSNYLAFSDYYYSMTLVMSHTSNLWTPSPKGKVIPGTAAKTKLDLHPVLFLKFDIKLIGSGTENDPYIIK